ncbi:hypothetical protein ASPTUDRAFT_136841, partial [Aspergillus tubingensis CBS 134.48]
LLRGRRVIAGNCVASNSASSCDVVGVRRYRARGTSFAHFSRPGRLIQGKLAICDQELILDNVLIRRVDSRRSYRADTTF